MAAGGPPDNKARIEYQRIFRPRKVEREPPPVYYGLTEKTMELSRREALLAAGAGAVTATPGSEMPVARIGSHQISRLIVGGNPVSGNSHLSGQMSREMLDYFTAANVKRMLHDCERAGINTWQSRGDRHIRRLLHEYRLEGGRLQWIAQTASEMANIPRNIQDIVHSGAIGVYHHGTATDRFWAAGNIEQAREMLKVMRQAGVLVGLGTHIPEVIDYTESNNWDLDFYMTCVYNLSRPEEEKKRLAGEQAPKELFWDLDRVEMLKRVKQTTKPCLIFKVYGASRHCDSRERMLSALKLVFEYAKPNDAVVIGMFPKYTEQVRENCGLLMEAMGKASS